MNISESLIRNFPHTPTEQQLEVFGLLARFFAGRQDNECFVLKGYAGTGKTSIIAALVRSLNTSGVRSVLLAPTGRAAKVMSNYSGRKALTIHKKIYRKKQAMSLEMDFVLAENNAENTLFIVDEASMIADAPADFGRNSLLEDLLDYVYNMKNCKLMLVGDTAQLPPVGSPDSPALDAARLRDNYGLEVFAYEMTSVLRQAGDSGILYNATAIRDLIRDDLAEFPSFRVKGFPDIFRMTGERLTEGLDYAYNSFGMENTLVICRSNKNANLYNQQIRNRILYREEEITGGDYLMVVRNNYFWFDQAENSPNSFIANGDIARVRKVRNIREMYGFRFAEVVLDFVDYPDAEPLQCRVMLESLYAEGPDISREAQLKLFEAAMEDYADIPGRKERREALRTNEYYNALHVKFAYAITCHKAQGGQWDAVFIDQGFLTEEMIDVDFLRWLYTAVTRSVKQLFLVNFSDAFFE